VFLQIFKPKLAHNKWIFDLPKTPIECRIRMGCLPKPWEA